MEKYPHGCKKCSYEPVEFDNYVCFSLATSHLSLFKAKDIKLESGHYPRKELVLIEYIVFQVLWIRDYNKFRREQFSENIKEAFT